MIGSHRRQIVASAVHGCGNRARSLNGFLKSQSWGGAALSSDPTQCTGHGWKFTGTPQKTKPRSHYRVVSTSNTEIRAKDQDEVNNKGTETPELLTVKTGRRPGKGSQWEWNVLETGLWQRKGKESSRRTDHREKQERFHPGQLLLISLLLSFSFTKILTDPRIKSEIWEKARVGNSGIGGKFRSGKRKGNDVIVV